MFIDRAGVLLQRFSLRQEKIITNKGGSEGESINGLKWENQHNKIN